MTALTIDAWVYLRAYAPGPTAQVAIVAKWGPGGSGDDSYNLAVGGDGRFFLEVSDGLSTGSTISSRNSSSAIPLNSWARVTGTWRAPGDIHLYLNATEVSGASYSGVGQNTSKINDNAQEVWIGRSVADAPGTFLNALVDEVKMYNGVVAISPGPTPPTPNLLASITPTSIGGSTANIAAATDGDPNTLATLTHDGGTGTNGLMWDLGASLSVSRIAVKYQTGNREIVNAIDLSLDGVNWTTVFTHSGESVIHTPVDTVPRTFRYIRWNVTQTSAGASRVSFLYAIEVA